MKLLFFFTSFLYWKAKKKI